MFDKYGETKEGTFGGNQISRITPVGRKGNPNGSSDPLWKDKIGY